MNLALKNIKVKLLTLVLFLPLAYLFSISTGEANIPFSAIFDALLFQRPENKIHEVLLFEFRIPEALTAVLASIALATSGLLMQSYFRNPLAGPSVLGVSSGSSFGIVLLLISFPSLMNNSAETKLFMVLFATLGAIAVLLILTLIQFRIRNIETLLIIGLLLSYFISACENMLLYSASAENIKTYVHWGLGSFSKTSYQDLGIMSIVILTFVMASYFLSARLDVFQFSNETIRNAGISRNKEGLIIIMLSGILCAVVTAFCGPIAFIGLCVPHIARMYLKTTRHFYLLTGGILIAANLGLFCSAIARLSIFGNQLPVNSITAFLGAPFIVYILIRSKKDKIA